MFFFNCHLYVRHDSQSHEWSSSKYFTHKNIFMLHIINIFYIHFWSSTIYFMGVMIFFEFLFDFHLYVRHENIYIYIYPMSEACQYIWQIFGPYLTGSHLWYESSICVSWLVHTCDMTRRRWGCFCSLPPVYATWLTFMSAISHSYVCHDSFICMPWHIHMCDMTHFHERYDSFICWTWLVHLCDMTRPRDSIPCMTRLVHVFERTSWHVYGVATISRLLQIIVSCAKEPDERDEIIRLFCKRTS